MASTCSCYPPTSRSCPPGAPAFLPLTRHRGVLPPPITQQPHTQECRPCSSCRPPARPPRRAHRSEEAGDAFAIDMGGTNFRIMHVRFSGKREELVSGATTPHARAAGGG